MRKAVQSSRFFQRGSAGRRVASGLPPSLAIAVLLISSAVAAEPRPNVLLIVSDDQRPDTIAALGNPVIETPSLDRLVRRGSVLRRAICANPICTPSRAELLTGCSGLRSGVFDFGGRIDPRLPTLPEPFAEAGYATWYSGKWHNNGRPADHGFQRTRRLFAGGGARWYQPQTDYRGHEVTGYKGWLFYDEPHQPRPELGVGLTPHISQLIADAAIETIAGSGASPFFIHLNFTAPHDPLMLPPGWEDRYDPATMPLPVNYRPVHPFDHGNQGGRDEQLLPVPRTPERVRADLAAYYAVISHMDAQIDRVLTALDDHGKTANTIVVFCSDHGLAMGSHGLRGKQNMYEHTIGVPLILAGPGIPAAKQFTGQAYLRDLFPTLCELAGLPVPEVDGRSQVPVLQGRQASMYQHVVGYFRDSQRMIRGGRWKLIHYPLINHVQLFDLVSDPAEVNNLADHEAHAATRRRLERALQRWLDAARAAAPTEGQ